MKLIFTVSLFISLMVSSVSHAGALKVGDELAVRTMSVLRENGFATVVQFVNKAGKTVKSVVALPTPKSTLRNYNPSVISKTLNGLKRGSQNSGALVSRVMTQKLLRFPVESAGFFTALGAVMTYELIFNYAQNPVAYQQLVESQMDPVGQLAFYFFMVGNGVSAEPLMHMVSEGKLPRRLAPFIPFFGLSVGSVASNIVHELGHAPNMWACARGLVTGKGLQTQVCDEAANSWNNRGGAAGIANEWAPSLISLVGSTIVSGLVQKGTNGFGKMVMAQAVRKGIVQVSVKVVGNATTSQVIRIGAMEVATLFIPGGMFVKGYKVVSFVTQLAVFTWIDEVMRRPIDFAYQNLTRGRSLQNMNNRVENLRAQARAGRYQSTPLALNNELSRFGRAMSEWRQVNLSEVLEAQGNWEQALADITNSYKSAELFYADFINHIQQKKFGRYKQAYADGSEVRIIDQIFPLYGISATGLAAPINQMLMTLPDVVESAQMQTIDQVLISIQNRSFYRGKNLPNLGTAEKNQFTQYMRGLSQNRPVDIGQSLNRIIEAAKPKYTSARAMSECPDCVSFTPLQKHLIAVLKALGNPSPKMTPGKAYADIYQNYPEYADIIQKTKYPRTYGELSDSYRVSTDTLAESMLASMILGPDAEKESLVKKRSGYAAIFKAPGILKDHSLDFMVPESAVVSRGGGATGLSVFSADLANKGGSGKVHDSAFSYLSNGGIRSNILNEDSLSFSNWWARHVETRFVSAWALFESQYQENIAKLVQRLRARRSAWNQSETPNGILASLSFENSQYLAILKEMATHLALSQNSRLSVFPNRESSAAQPKPWEFNLSTSLLSLRRPTPAPSIMATPIPNTSLIRAISWHGKISSSVTRLQNLLQRIKAAHNVNKSNPEKVLTISNLSLDEIQSASAQVESALKEAQQFFLAPQGMRLVLTKDHKQLLQTCLNGLKKNTGEIANFAMIANAVSYRSRQDENGFVNPRCENMMRQQKSLGVSFIQKVAGCE